MAEVAEVGVPMLGERPCQGPGPLEDGRTERSAALAGEARVSGTRADLALEVHIAASEGEQRAVGGDPADRPPEPDDFVAVAGCSGRGRRARSGSATGGCGLLCRDRQAHLSRGGSRSRPGTMAWPTTTSSTRYVVRCAGVTWART